MRRRWLLLFLLALVPRLPGLHLFLTTDEPFFVQKAAEVASAFLKGQFQGTYWHFYPGVTMSWLDGLGLAFQWAAGRLAGTTSQPFTQYIQGSILDVLVATRLPYALLSAGFVAAVYCLARRLLGERSAWLAALLLAFDPFFLAHSRVAAGDAAATEFLALSALAFFSYLQARRRAPPSSAGQPGANDGSPNPPGGEAAPTRQALPGWRWLLLSAGMGGLAALTKAPGQLMAPFVLAVAAGDWLANSRRARRPDWQLAKRWLLELAVWGGAAAGLFVALWPAMWTDPVTTVGRMLEETFGKVEAGHLVFFMGQPTLDPGPWFYPYVIALRLTPITSILAGLSAVIIVAGWIKPGTSRPGTYRAASLLWAFVMTLFLFGELSPKKQDRYLLAVFPFLDMLAAFALVEIISRCGALWKSGAARFRPRVSGFALALLLGLHALPVITAYPYYLAYFNPLLGGLPAAVTTTLVGWGEGMEQVAAYLNQRPDAGQLYVAAVPSQTLLPFLKGTGKNFYTNDVALRADVVVLYISQVQRLAPSPEIVRYFQSLQPEHVVTVQGIPYAWIYPGPRLISDRLPADVQPVQVGFGEQLELAGYRLVPGEGTAAVTLYWHALVAMPVNYTISLRLVAADGSRLAQQDSWPANGLLPTTQWRVGDYVQDAHRLQLAPVAGSYVLQLVVYDAASGQALRAPVELPVAPGGEVSS